MDLDLIKPTAEEIVEIANLFQSSDPRHEQLLKLVENTKDGDHGKISI